MTTYNGILNLVFASNFTPEAGSSFNLFDFNIFSGSFDPTHINVTGFDCNLLDFNTLAFDSILHVAAVPLPASIWLFASCLVPLLTGMRKKTIAS